MKPMLLAVMLAASVASAQGPKRPVPIYIGPVVRGGFVEADKGVLDSIKDIQGELRKNRTFAVVTDETKASLKLYVVSRGKSAGSTDVSSGTGTVVGGVAVGTGTTTNVKDSRVEALLRVGDYERTFVGESEEWITGTWKRCAKLLVKDLIAWVDANRERIP